MSTTSDYQAAILQVTWFVGAHALPDGVKCYPTPSSINKYSIFSPIENFKVNQ